jgi:hypothetical protein
MIIIILLLIAVKIILIAVLLLLLSIKPIEKFTEKKEQDMIIYNNYMKCGKSNIKMDEYCNIYTIQKLSISKLEQDYNSARRNTENKYEVWEFAKNEISLKKIVLDKAIIFKSNLDIRNKIEDTLNIINAVVAANKIIILSNNGYYSSTIAYKNALDEYNKIAKNAHFLQINENGGGYTTPENAYSEMINKYNNAVFIAIATNTQKSKNLIPSISKTTEMNELINAQTAANDAFNEANETLIIPSLNIYNQAAKDAKMANYYITDNLSTVQKNAQIAYENAQKSEETSITIALSDYKDATKEELDKFIIFYTAIKELQSAFYNYCNLLINPEIAYKPSLDNDNDNNNNDNDKCDLYEKIISDLNKLSEDISKIDAEISNVRENSMKTAEYKKVEENKKNVIFIFDHLEKSYLNKITNYNNEIINMSRDFANKYIDLNTVNDVYYNSIVSYNQTQEKQEYNKKVIDTMSTIIQYDKIKNSLKICYPDG